MYLAFDNERLMDYHVILLLITELIMTAELSRAFLPATKDHRVSCAKQMNIELAPLEYIKALTWDEARLYCFSLNIDGKVGWRLPTMLELHWLGSRGLITSEHTQTMNYRKYPRYWSSEEHVDYSGCAWLAMPLLVDMHTTWDDKYVNTTLVRPVRDC